MSTFQEASIDATELWSQYEVLTAELAQSLYESIHITFEPTLATQFKYECACTHHTHTQTHQHTTHPPYSAHSCASCEHACVCAVCTVCLYKIQRIHTVHIHRDALTPITTSYYCIRIHSMHYLYLPSVAAEETSARASVSTSDV